MAYTKTNPLDIFIEGWGRMGSSWGISKVMAEIYALLYLSDRPLSLEEMSYKLQTSRSNISLNVRSLQDLGVVKKVFIRGDRKDYYTIEEDIEKVAVRVMEEKKKRELDPALEIVAEAISAAAALKDPNGPDGPSNEFYTTRLTALRDLLESIEQVFQVLMASDRLVSEDLEESKAEPI